MLLSAICWLCSAHEQSCIVQNEQFSGFHNLKEDGIVLLFELVRLRGYFYYHMMCADKYSASWLTTREYFNSCDMSDIGNLEGASNAITRGPRSKVLPVSTTDYFGT
jgi:hypothetical protein